MSVEAYLEEHNLHEVLKDAVLQLVEARPAEPIKFLVQYLSSKHGVSSKELQSWEAKAAVMDRAFEPVEPVDGDGKPAGGKKKAGGKKGGGGKDKDGADADADSADADADGADADATAAATTTTTTTAATAKGKAKKKASGGDGAGAGMSQQEAAAAAAAELAAAGDDDGNDDDSESDDEDDDDDDDDDGDGDDDEPPVRQRGRRGAICCEPVDDRAELADAPAPKVVPKSPEARRALEDALAANIMFAHLDADERSEVFDAMFEVVYSSGDTIISQGDEGDNFYVIDDGKCSIYVFKEGGPAPPGKKVLDLERGGSFGELALIYGSPRAATVKADSDMKLWAIDRATYRRILMGTTMRKRKLYERFLEDVPILADLSKYERITVADALEPYHFRDGEVIIRQGDPGDRFYIIVTGEVRVTQRAPTGEEGEVARLHRSNYFGEIALLTARPRAATVTALGPVKCIGLDRERFNRVLGPCEDILRRNMSTYNRYVAANI